MEVILHLRLGSERTPVFSYDDLRSSTSLEAAERAWTLTNGHPGDFDEEDLALREEFERCVPGHSVGVGDGVEIDGRMYECRRDGFV